LFCNQRLRQVAKDLLYSQILRLQHRVVYNILRVDLMFSTTPRRCVGRTLQYLTFRGILYSCTLLGRNVAWALRKPFLNHSFRRLFQRFISMTHWQLYNFCFKKHENISFSTSFSLKKNGTRRRMNYYFVIQWDISETAMLRACKNVCLREITLFLHARMHNFHRSCKCTTDDENLVFALFILCNSLSYSPSQIQYGRFIRARMRKNGDMIGD
jgi:hypothetical protein